MFAGWPNPIIRNSQLEACLIESHRTELSSNRTFYQVMMNVDDLLLVLVVVIDDQL